MNTHKQKGTVLGLVPSIVLAVALIGLCSLLAVPDKKRRIERRSDLKQNYKRVDDTVNLADGQLEKQH